jgi:hypothetical protein
MRMELEVQRNLAAAVGVDTGIARRLRLRLWLGIYL